MLSFVVSVALCLFPGVQESKSPRVQESVNALAWMVVLLMFVCFCLLACLRVSCCCCC